MRKLIMLMKRAPSLGVEEFQRRWRDERGPAVAKVAGLRGYVQSHALLQGYAKGELLFDGIEELWFDDDAAQAAFARSTEGTLHGLVDPARLIPMPVDVLVMKDNPPPENAVKNIEFVNRRPGMALDPFRRYWREIHGPLASTIPPLRRYEQNHLSLSAYAQGEPPYDGLAITWFASTAAMREGTTTPQYAATRADEANFLPDGHLPIIITREQIFVNPRG